MSLLCGICHRVQTPFTNEDVCFHCAANLLESERSSIISLIRLEGIHLIGLGVLAILGIVAVMFFWLELLALMGIERLSQYSAGGAGLLFLTGCWWGLKHIWRGCRILRPDDARMDNELAKRLAEKRVDAFAVQIDLKGKPIDGMATVVAGAQDAEEARFCVEKRYNGCEIKEVRKAKMWPWEGAKGEVPILMMKTTRTPTYHFGTRR